MIVPVPKDYTKSLLPFPDLALAHSCLYHPITFLKDCLECNESCSFLSQKLGQDQERLISKQDRDDLWKYLYSHDHGLSDNPILRIREKYGINIGVEAKKLDSSKEPYRHFYLLNIIEKEVAKQEIKLLESMNDGVDNLEFKKDELRKSLFRKHWRLYWKGSIAKQGFTLIASGGFLMPQMPESILSVMNYYEVHTKIMQGKVDPEEVLGHEKFDYSKLDDSVRELNFESYDEAYSHLVGQFKQLFDQMIKEGKTEQEAKDLIHRHVTSIENFGV